MWKVRGGLVSRIWPNLSNAPATVSRLPDVSRLATFVSPLRAGHYWLAWSKMLESTLQPGECSFKQIVSEVSKSRCDSGLYYSAARG